MKKFLTPFIVLFAAFSIFALSNTAVQTNENILALTISNVVRYDTVVSTATSTLTSNYSTDRFGCEYALVWDAITGTGSDSVSLSVIVESVNPSNVVLYSATVDSIVSSAGGAVMLDLGSTVLGSKYNIKLTGTANNGTQVILNRLYIYKRRPLVSTYDR